MAVVFPQVAAGVAGDSAVVWDVAAVADLAAVVKVAADSAEVVFPLAAARVVADLAVVWAVAAAAVVGYSPAVAGVAADSEVVRVAVGSAAAVVIPEEALSTKEVRLTAVAVFLAAPNLHLPIQTIDTHMITIITITMTMVIIKHIHTILITKLYL